MKPTLLLGAPGTGKTYQLVQKILEIKPDRFALVSFTRRAASEAKTRLRAYYKESELKYIRTIHSLCFELLGLKTTQVLGWEHMRKFGAEYGYEFIGRYRVQEDDSYNMLSDDDIEFREMQIQVAKMQIEDMRDMWLRYAQWKIKNNLFDYNDMLEGMLDKVRQNLIPSFDLLCVDEIQDLTPLQLNFVKLMTDKAKQIVYAGDDNQMIFEWAGVDRDKFFQLAAECQVNTLYENHRIDGTIGGLGNRIARRQTKVISQPTIGNDDLYNIRSLEYLSVEPMEFNQKESYLILARNSYLLSRVVQGLDYLGEGWDWLGEDYMSSKGHHNIRVSTIHGAKGAEADNVILLTDVSPATYENLDKDSEHRVWYVAVTRAKKKLWIVQPQTDMYYDLF